MIRVNCRANRHGLRADGSSDHPGSRQLACIIPGFRLDPIAIRMLFRPMPLARAAASPPGSAARRRLLTAAAAWCAAPLLALAQHTHANAGVPRIVTFSHTHTGESLSLAYAHGDTYLPDALARVNWFLRDFRNGESQPIDPQLLDRLHLLSELTGTRAPFEVISGYRSPATNEALRRRGGGVASHSLHLEGRAIDVRLADVALADLRDAATSLRAGGVGFYPESRFVHLDTGRMRRW
jgi:uncharacterized protein YcbK (DUF882 family)